MSKFCAKCGTNLNENDAFCPLCGFASNASLPTQPIEKVPVQPQVKTQPAATAKAPDPKPEKKKKGGVLTVIAIIIAVISSFLSITLFALLLMSSDKTCSECGEELVCPVCSAKVEDTTDKDSQTTTIPETEATKPAEESTTVAEKESPFVDVNLPEITVDSSYLSKDVTVEIFDRPVVESGMVTAMLVFDSSIDSSALQSLEKSLKAFDVNGTDISAQVMLNSIPNTNFANITFPENTDKIIIYFK